MENNNKEHSLKRECPAIITEEYLNYTGSFSSLGLHKYYLGIEEGQNFRFSVMLPLSNLVIWLLLRSRLRVVASPVFGWRLIISLAGLQHVWQLLCIHGMPNQCRSPPSSACCLLWGCSQGPLSCKGSGSTPCAMPGWATMGKQGKPET